MKKEEDDASTLKKPCIVSLYGADLARVVLSLLAPRLMKKMI